jgi:hypothetical protein
LSNLAYDSFDFAVKWHINNAEHFPKPAEFRSALQFKPKPAAVPQLQQQDYPKWMELVNNLFFVWLAKEVNSGNRVSNGVTIPELEMHERRAACCRLAEDFEAMEREGDPQANREWLQEAFKTQMGLIPVTNLRA